MREENLNGRIFYLGIVFLFLYAPIFYLIFYSFNEGGTMNSFTGFTWEKLSKLFLKIVA